MSSLRPADSLESNAESDLLERARLTLEVLEYREQAARYKAAAASLKAAMTAAQHGDLDPLKNWISGQRDSLGDATTLPQELRRQLAEFPELESIGIGPSGMRIDSSHQVHGSALAESDVDRNANRLDDTAEEVSRAISSPSSSSTSPWDAMIMGAQQRVAAKGTSNQFAGITAGAEDSSSAVVVDSDAVRASVAGNVCAMGVIDSDPSDSIDVGNRPWTCETHGAEIANGLDERRHGVEASDSLVELSEEVVTALAHTSTERKQRSFREVLLAPHMWISFVVHAIMIVAMSAFIIVTVQKTELMSIVAATVEADNVLMETPMEMPNDIEKPMEETAFPLSPATEISAISVDTSLPTVPMDTGIGQVPSPAAAFSDASASAISGTKMVSGAEFFGVKATGNTFVYVVDSSPSMRRDGAFDAAKEEVLRSLGSMKPKQRYFINFFGKEIDPLTFQSGVVEKYPVYATSENLRKTMEWLGRIQIQKEGLPPNDALREAIAMQPDGIFLLFDGDTKVDVAAFLRKVNRSNDIISGDTPKVPIHVVHFFQSEFQKAMMRIAEENGGTYRFIPRPEKPTRTKK